MAPATHHERLVQEAGHLAKRAADAIRQLDKKHSAESVHQASLQQRRLLQQKPRLGHKALFGDRDNPAPKLGAVKDPSTGRVTAHPASVKRVVEQLYTGLQLPPGGIKTGEYLPDRAPRNYPWRPGAPGVVDPYDLTTRATQLPARPFLYRYVKDEAIFFECCKTLSSGKAPGPDGVTNEVIKMLPVQVKKLLHQLMMLMWVTGITPTAWKHSHTCLVHKAGDAADPRNYRPIGLANTLYKLWTRLVTYLMYEYAEEHSIFSSSQAGFRKGMTTHRQIQTLVMAYEDARLSSQDLYNMQVDFSSAFNSTNHDLTLQLLYDLGFPTDSIEVVKHLYTDATTAYKTAYGLTEVVQVDRGTLQGDTLSPFLFIVYIEPLVRWFQVGGRGYKFGTMDKSRRLHTACSNMPYADDLSVTTGTLPDVKVQARKLTAYSDWGAMDVNTVKTTVTAILYRSAAASLVGRTLKDKLEQLPKAQLENKIIVQGRPVKYIPPSEPSKYLGIMVTPTLDWKPQFQYILQKVKD